VITSAVFALDPMLVDVNFGDVLRVLAKVFVAFALLLVAVMLMIWFERKVIAKMQNRIGPNVAGPWGILQTLADGIKLFFKEDLVPDRSDRFVFKLAPYLSLVPAFLTFAVIPIGGNFRNDGGVVRFFGGHTYLQVVDAPIGLLFFLAMSSVAVYGVMLAGWSSGSKYPLLGSVRATAQMVSYEAALGLALAAVFLKTGSLSTHDIVAGQVGNIIDWNIVQTWGVPFIIFWIAGTAELNRPPFDLVEAEQELVGGFHTEYSSIRFAMFYLAEFMNTITMAAIIVTVFLGGPNGPSFGAQWVRSWILPTVWFMVKLLVFLFAFVWFRATLPRFRYDQLMDLGWKVLIPLALGWFVLLGAVDVFYSRGWDIGERIGVVAIGFVVMTLAALLLRSAVRSGARKRAELEEVAA
jgi:NADH-quinone oxidoreductase subunit H